CGMAEGTLDTHRLQGFRRIEKTGDADNRIQLEECQRNSRIVQVDCATLDLVNQGFWQRVDIDLQTHCECGFRANSRTDSTQAGTLNCLMKFKSVAPERLIAKSIKAENLLSLFNLLNLILNRGVFYARWFAA